MSLNSQMISDMRCSIRPPNDSAENKSPSRFISFVNRTAMGNWHVPRPDLQRAGQTPQGFLTGNRIRLWSHCLAFAILDAAGANRRELPQPAPTQQTAAAEQDGADSNNTKRRNPASHDRPHVNLPSDRGATGRARPAQGADQPKSICPTTPPRNVPPPA
jgi:hypothetical protein